MSREIPIFFSTDDNYIPYLDVAIASLFPQYDKILYLDCDLVVLGDISQLYHTELGGFGGFSKKKLANPNSPEYIEKFITQCNKGVLTHRLSYPIGFLPMLFIPNVCAFSIAFPVAMVNLFLNILPTLILRYNTPKLKMMLQRMKRR